MMTTEVKYRFHVFPFTAGQTVGFQHLGLADGWYWRDISPGFDGMTPPVGPFEDEAHATRNAQDAMSVRVDAETASTEELEAAGEILDKLKGDEYCTECRVEYHDACSMTDGCPCCDETKRQLAESGVECSS